MDGWMDGWMDELMGMTLDFPGSGDGFGSVTSDIRLSRGAKSNKDHNQLRK